MNSTSPRCHVGAWFGSHGADLHLCPPDLHPLLSTRHSQSSISSSDMAINAGGAFADQIHLCGSACGRLLYTRRHRASLDPTMFRRSAQSLLRRAASSASSASSQVPASSAHALRSHSSRAYHFLSSPSSLSWGAIGAFAAGALSGWMEKHLGILNASTAALQALPAQLDVNCAFVSPCPMQLLRPRPMRRRLRPPGSGASSWSVGPRALIL